MNHLRGCLLLAGAALLQWWWSTHFTVWGLSPQLLLVLTVAIAARQGSDAGMVYGFIWGLFLDSHRPEIFGGNAFTMMLAGWVTGTIRRQIDVVDLVSQCVVVFLLTWASFLFYGLLGLVFAKTFLWPGWAAFLFDPFYNCLLVPLGLPCWAWLRARS